MGTTDGKNANRVEEKTGEPEKKRGEDMETEGTENQGQEMGTKYYAVCEPGTLS